MLASVMGLALCGPGGALAQIMAPDAIPYPADATSEPVVQAWIDRYLPTQGYVVGAWSPHVVMLVAVNDKLKVDNYPQVVTQVFSQVLTPDAANAAGWRAAVQTEVFDCERGRYQAASSLYYARADLKGGYDRQDGDGAWITPDPGATMDTVERAACFYGRKAYAAQHPPAAEAPAARPPEPRRPRRRRAAPKPAATVRKVQDQKAAVRKVPAKAAASAAAARRRPAG
jgi:hypothetical protein